MERALTVMYDVWGNGDADIEVDVERLALGGRSSGGAYAAYRLACQMRPGVSSLVMWGATNPLEMRGHTWRGDGPAVDVLVVHGSNDGLTNGVSKSRREEFWALLPPTEGDRGEGGIGDGDSGGGGSEDGRAGGRTRYAVIEGGNHAWFGHYGPQRMDGERTITLEGQQGQVAAETADFLLGREGRTGGGRSRSRREADACTRLLDA